LPIIHVMLSVIECLVAIGAITIAGMFAGRIAAMSLTAITAATAVLVMPPFMSWQVEREVDLLALLFQSIVGLIVAYRWPARTQNHRRSAAPPDVGPKRHPSKPACSLTTVVHSAIEQSQNVDLKRRIGDFEITGELDGGIAASQNDLERILRDGLKMALSDSRVQHISVHTGKQPSMDRITVVAQYDTNPGLPRLRLLGKSDRQQPIATENWPGNCSVSYFDNGHEHIYLISIYRHDAV